MIGTRLNTTDNHASVRHCFDDFDDAVFGLNYCAEIKRQNRRDGMRTLISVLLMFLLGISAEGMLVSRFQQNGEQNASPEQQAQPASPPGQATSRAAVQSVTGCVVKSDNGYSLMTADGSYAIDTSQDLSSYVNKQVKVTGVLEHHTAAVPSATTGNPTTVTDIRLRMIATVIGDCNQKSK